MIISSSLASEKTREKKRETRKTKMFNLFLLFSMVACINAQAILSMLLFLILTYLAAAFWLISQKLIYAGLLYVLVYVGAIVVLFVYVIQLVDTVQLNIATLEQSPSKTFSKYLSFDFLIGTLIFAIAGYLITQTNFSLVDLTSDSSFSGASLSSLSIEYFNVNLTSNLDLLAQNLFNSYSYVLLLTVTAIILAIIGPVNLALSRPLVTLQ